jgi:pilus assembly protein Flp/PilA
MNLFRRFLADEEGATAIEYALIGALMAAAVVAALAILTPGISAAFQKIATKLSGVAV